jgi:hypothetical protein
MGTRATPVPATGIINGKPHLFVFSAPGKIQDILEDVTKKNNPAIPYISVRTANAADFCLQYAQEKNGSCAGILVNPGDYAFSVDFAALRQFDTEWKAAGGAEKRGFWIPGMTTEEEDFWQEHGID